MIIRWEETSGRENGQAGLQDYLFDIGRCADGPVLEKIKNMSVDLERENKRIEDIRQNLNDLALQTPHTVGDIYVNRPTT